jgi:nitroimidazol reductase NimA-like FMN-containing flavoprotein (pyridoxamine 5'-phosphate oxidase superfamily)
MGTDPQGRWRTMRLIDTRTGIEWMERDECVRLLGGEVIGRLAVVDGGAPHIFPVNYVLDGEDVVLRTAPGTKLDSVGRARACFEIDAFDREHRSGWSVVVAGHLEELGELSGEAERVRQLPVDPWADGERDHWLRLVSDRITGRIVRGPDGGAGAEEERGGRGH